MKKTSLILLLITIITYSCLGQNMILPLPPLSKNIDTIYVNEKWETIPKGEKYTFFRTIEKINDSLFAVKDYYKNGKLEMSGAYKSANQEEEIGEFVWYTEKGEQLHLFNYQKETVLVESNEYGFKIEFPKGLSVEIEKRKTKKGNMILSNFTSSDSITKTLCSVMYIEFPNKSIIKDSILTKFIQLTDTWKLKYGGVIAEKDIELKGYIGKEIMLETKVYRSVMIMRSYLVKNKIYMILGGPYSIKDINSPVSRFLNSFDLINNN